MTGGKKEQNRRTCPVVESEKLVDYVQRLMATRFVICAGVQRDSFASWAESNFVQSGIQVRGVFEDCRTGEGF
jgi:hypothetical protein